MSKVTKQDRGRHLTAPPTRGRQRKMTAQGGGSHPLPPSYKRVRHPTRERVRVEQPRVTVHSWSRRRHLGAAVSPGSPARSLFSSSDQNRGQQPTLVTTLRSGSAEKLQNVSVVEKSAQSQSLTPPLLPSLPRRDDCQTFSVAIKCTLNWNWKT